MSLERGEMWLWRGGRLLVMCGRWLGRFEKLLRRDGRWGWPGRTDESD